MPVSSNVRYVMDTNVFRDIQRGKINQASVQQVRNDLNAVGSKCFASPLSLFELASHIKFFRFRYHERYRGSFLAIDTLCDGFIEDPDFILATSVFGVPSSRMPMWLEKEAMRVYAKLVIDTQSRWSLLRNYRNLNPRFIRKQRNRFEKGYWYDLEKLLSFVVPGYRKKKKKKRNLMVPAGPVRSAIVKSLKSTDFIDQLILSLGRQYGLSNSELTSLPISSCYDLISAFVEHYRTICLMAVEGGYKIEKNKNDRHDQMFLAYLAYSDTIFVTQEKSFQTKIPKTCPQATRIIGFSDLL